ncbi:MAG: hypothetical protein JKY65_15055 [Planctomycetes bacterium]|nr:hypothetical protein [Planctomycetota bacterium]
MFSPLKHLRESGEAFAANWMLGLLAGLLGTIPVAGTIVLTSWQGIVGRSAGQGESAELAHLLDTTQALERAQPGFGVLVAAALVSALASFLGVVGLVVALGSSVGLFFICGACGFATGIMADRPTLSFLSAIQTVGAFSKQHPAEMFKLLTVCGGVAALGSVACGVGLLVSVPVAAGALYLAGREVNVELETTAAAAGIELR